MAKRLCRPRCRPCAANTFPSEMRRACCSANWARLPSNTSVTMADDKEKDVRMFAIDTLARIGSRTAEAAIIRALKDRDINVAAAAAAALGEVGTTAAVAPLIAALASDSWVRCAAAKSLGQLGGFEAAATLTRLTMTGEDELAAHVALRTLAAMKAV